MTNLIAGATIGHRFEIEDSLLCRGNEIRKYIAEINLFVGLQVFFNLQFRISSKNLLKLEFDNFQQGKTRSFEKLSLEIQY